ncbi:MULTISPECIES: hypothetical protein [Caballeronia]|uniref:hypothetical protein n=1 Tax=Caballeronia TaxID=1827195 RepID=UPI000A967E43|nr:MULTISPECIES: hypothetical protein [Caballeronia]
MKRKSLVDVYGRSFDSEKHGVTLPNADPNRHPIAIAKHEVGALRQHQCCAPRGAVFSWFDVMCKRACQSLQVVALAYAAAPAIQTGALDDALQLLEKDALPSKLEEKGGGLARRWAWGVGWK